VLESLQRVIESVGEKHQLLIALGRFHLSQGDTELGNEFLMRAMNGQSA
jgi:hypothetical protein